MMEQVFRKRLFFWAGLGVLLMISACSRTIDAPEEPQATLIDLSPQQTLTALAVSEDSQTGESPAEPTSTSTEPALAATETPAPQATDTPPDAPPTSETTVEPQETATGNALMVTQTVAPVNIPGDGQWMIAYLNTPPVIDGDIGDWPGVIYAIDQVTFGPEFYANQVDLFGEFKIGWDAEYLYLGVLVRDSRFVQLATDALLFQGDSLEVLLDTDWAGDQASDTLSADDYQLGFSPGNLLSAPAPEAYLWAPSEREGIMQQAVVAGRLTDDGYMMEVAIGWVELGVSPAGGMTFGFLLSISDNDTLGKTEQQTVISIAEIRNLTNPTTWIPFTLAAP